MRLALFEPDIPQNAGAILRLAACLGAGVDIIGPCGFVLDDRRLRRAGMDYTALAAYTVHDSWAAFLEARRRAPSPGRLVLLASRGERRYAEFAFRPDDTLILGRESAGAPDFVHDAADARIRIPMAPGARSLNVAVAAAIVLAEALRRTGSLPDDRTVEDAAE